VERTLHGYYVLSIYIFVEETLPRYNVRTVTVFRGDGEEILGK
jgi:hypothetical protein